MGICGTAMGNVALLARTAGHEVLGADAGVYPPMSDVLAEAGITVHEGYDAARLAELAPDLVVIGNAMSRGNPEVEWLLESRALRFTSLPALLAETVLAGRKNLVICGTHGKTTTTSLTAFLLRENGRDPGFLIGGVPLDPPVGQHLGGAAEPFVIEGDEYDSAFFDKRSKFIHYAPHIAVLNNLEFDHADIFRDLEDVQRTFRHLSRIVPRNGFVLVNGDDTNLAALGDMDWTKIVRVGTGETNDVRITNFEEGPEGVAFTLTWGGREWGTVSWTTAGLFNARNAAMAATAAGLALDPSDPTGLSLAPLARFRGVRRRQEIKLQRDDLVVMEDFGHHPTAIAETLRSLRARYPAHRLVAAFEPRSNTARSRRLQDDFIQALRNADTVYVGAVSRADRMTAAERFDPAVVCSTLAAMSTAAHTADSNTGVLDRLLTELTVDNANGPMLVVFFTNGSFDGIIQKFVAQAEGKG
ncbi:Mur ligase family protein [Synoicihabitans lomoniglobus]|uniref:Mur ligase family protein n=2 Tax=Synoicihabitans lomoniglobus TaxID=2909285 RepID=A0AAF0I407_9BACT|nr:Mur ligase family protein [Opitutaceae bacterium LMO-M01]